MERSATVQQDDYSHVQLIQQPTPQHVTVFQQLPSAVAPPATLRPGHIREDLVELMMIQNAQMHQVIMNNMTMSALRSFGYTRASDHSGPHATAEADPEVWHHHYSCPPCLSYPTWVPVSLAPTHSNVPPQIIPSFYESVNPQHNIHIEHRDRKAFPPPPPSSVRGTVDPDIPPVSEFYEAEIKQHKQDKTQS